ncbi:MAG: DUF5131 family protein [Deltaproteobacteria bacterium]|nr:DUF5131 family protein [Deltaproteobacteria bacterium]
MPCGTETARTSRRIGSWKSWKRSGNARSTPSRSCPRGLRDIRGSSNPKNVWLGTSIATNADLYRIHDLVKAVPENLRFVSIEPIHEDLDFWFGKKGIGWIIIGAETGNRKGKIVSEKLWIQRIIDNGRVESIPVFVKENARWPEDIYEFPRT